jgi:hypothetical protein
VKTLGILQDISGWNVVNINISRRKDNPRWLKLNQDNSGYIKMIKIDQAHWTLFNNFILKS